MEDFKDFEHQGLIWRKVNYETPGLCCSLKELIKYKNYKNTKIDIWTCGIFFLFNDKCFFSIREELEHWVFGCQSSKGRFGDFGIHSAHLNPTDVLDDLLNSCEVERPAVLNYKLEIMNGKIRELESKLLTKTRPPNYRPPQYV